MSTDFGAELDAALNAHLDAMRTAADQAKQRIDRDIAGVAAKKAPQSGPPVSFDRDEEFEASLDAEGIPVPEEN